MRLVGYSASWFPHGAGAVPAATRAIRPNRPADKRKVVRLFAATAGQAILGSVTSRLRAFLSRSPERVHGRPEDLRRQLIARLAPGRRFLDVGCMWRVHGAYAFHAHDSGAATVTALDVTGETPEFRAGNAERANAVRFVQADVNDGALLDTVSPHDVVFCSGVLYHVPNPILTLVRLRALCINTLILDSATIPERDAPQSAIFLPFLDHAAREALAYRTPHAKVGLDSDFDPDRGYGNWFWAMTPSCVQALVRSAGFEIVEAYPFLRVLTLVCRPAAEVSYP